MVRKRVQAEPAAPPIQTSASVPTLILDFGNHLVKFIAGGVEQHFLHAVAEITVSQYEEARERGGRVAPYDFIQMGDKYYAVGRSAHDFTVVRRQGRTKYSRDYLGAIFASSVARSFSSNPQTLIGGLRLMASHSSADFRFRQFLADALLGRWSFNIGDTAYKFTVNEVKTYEEPFGSYCRVGFMKDARGNWSAPLQGLGVSVIDIGGGTCGVMYINAYGEPQVARSAARSIGMNTVAERLRGMLERDFADYFQDVKAMSEERLRRALRTGYYEGKGRTLANGKALDCRTQVEKALAPLFNDVTAMWQEQLFSGDDSDVVVLTGGGNGDLHERIGALLGHADIRLPDNPTELIYANVRGARDFDEILESYG